MNEQMPELKTCPACKRVLPLHYFNNTAIVDGEKKEICDSCFRRTGFPPVLTEVLPFDPMPSSTYPAFPTDTYHPDSTGDPPPE